jgi:ubiquitin-conjugating enzyme E2 J2
MASSAATKRLTVEFKNIQKSPPQYITAHPSDSNILEWHYIIDGPPDTPYYGGQYWGTLMFPPDYPFAPPAIRMHTPSGRFQPSARLCLSISDFHPKSFNPAWSVSTILTGLLSFMTSEEITTGSIRATEDERKFLANQTRWWNTTGGGSSARSLNGITPRRGVDSIRTGDGGVKFRAEWPEVDEANWKSMTDRKIDPRNGLIIKESATPASCAPGADALRRTAARINSHGGVIENAQNARNAGQGWLGRNRWAVVIGVLVVYALLARVYSEIGISGKEL